MNTSAFAQSAPLFASLDAPGPALPGRFDAPGCSEMELQKLLMDERMRCENHKTNYKTLKAEHARLQDEFTQGQNEVRRLLVDKESDQEKLQLLLAELRGDLLDKTREVEELRLQVLTPQRLELLKAQMQQEIDAPMRGRFNKLEEEAENYRREYNNLRLLFTRLQSEFDHQREESARVLEERKIRFEAEVSRLERAREEMAAQYRGSDPSRDGKRVESLLREKAQLHQRLKGLEAEVAELRAQRDNSGQQAENVQRIQVRQLAESQAAVKALEAERQSLRLQSERLDRELHQSHEQNALLTGRLHKAEREVNSLTSQVEGMRHAHKLEVASVRLESVRIRGEVERERDTLQGQVEGLQSDVEVLKGTVERQREVLGEKERDLVRRVQAAREEEFHKITALHEERLELENRLADLEQKRALLDAAGHAQKEEWEERLRGAQQGEESARKEVQSLRTKLQQKAAQLEELERQRTDNAELRQQNQDLGVQLGTLSHSEAELLEANQRLRDTLERLREETRTTRGQAERSQHDSERLVEEQRVQWLEEKHQLQEREAELQEKYGHAKDKLQRAALAQKKRKTLTENKEKRYQDKIQLLEAKIAELDLQTSTAKKRPSYSEEHAALNRRLKEMQRRHGEFRRLLLGNQAATSPSGPVLVTSTPAATLVPGVLGLHEEQHQRELSLLRRRLEELECSQQQQLEELGSGQHDSHPDL